VKTAYLAEYFRDVELRRRVLVGLNKGESLHSLCERAPVKTNSTPLSMPVVTAHAQLQ
jgi:hypothetical protein